MSPHRRENRWRMGISALAVVVISVIVSILAALIVIDRGDMSQNRASHAAAVARYQESLRGCARGNKLRRNLNQTVIRIQRDFLATARAARLAAVANATTPEERAFNQAAATAYAKYILELKPLPLTNCATAYRPPKGS